MNLTCDIPQNDLPPSGVRRSWQGAALPAGGICCGTVGAAPCHPSHMLLCVMSRLGSPGITGIISARLQLLLTLTRSNMRQQAWWGGWILPLLDQGQAGSSPPTHTGWIWCRFSRDPSSLGGAAVGSSFRLLSSGPMLSWSTRPPNKAGETPPNQAQPAAQ